MHVRMVGQRTGPGVQHAHQPDLASHETRIACQLLSGLGRRAEQQIIDDLLVLAGDETDLRRKREGQQEVWNT